MFRCRLLLILVAVLLMSASAQAVSVTTAVGNGADTYLSNDGQSGNYGPTSMHGGDSSIKIRYLAGTRMKFGMVRFDISGVTGPLTDATLSIEVTWAKTGRTCPVGVYGLVDESLDNWVESTVSYDTAPAVVPSTSGIPLGFYAVGPNTDIDRLGQIDLSGTGVFTSNTTDLNLDAFLAGDTNGLVTLYLIWEYGGDGTPEWSIATKEGAGSPSPIAPTLNLPYAVPEPATIALLGIGGVLALRRRK